MARRPLRKDSFFVPASKTNTETFAREQCPREITRGSALRRQAHYSKKAPEAELCGLAGVAIGRFSLEEARGWHGFLIPGCSFANQPANTPIEARFTWASASYWPRLQRQGNPPMTRTSRPRPAAVPMAKARLQVSTSTFDEHRDRCSGDIAVYGKGGHR